MYRRGFIDDCGTMNRHTSPALTNSALTSRRETEAADITYLSEDVFGELDLRLMRNLREYDFGRRKIDLEYEFISAHESVSRTQAIIQKRSGQLVFEAFHRPDMFPWLVERLIPIVNTLNDIVQDLLPEMQVEFLLYVDDTPLHCNEAIYHGHHKASYAKGENGTFVLGINSAKACTDVPVPDHTFTHDFFGSLDDSLSFKDRKRPSNPKVFFMGQDSSPQRSVYANLKGDGLNITVYPKFQQPWVATLSDACAHEFLLYIEGVTYSNRLKNLYLCDSVVLADLRGGHEEWWYPKLRAFTNYVPVDENTIISYSQLLRSDTKLMNQIKRNQDDLKRVFQKSMIHAYWRRLLHTLWGVLKSRELTDLSPLLASGNLVQSQMAHHPS